MGISWDFKQDTGDLDMFSSFVSGIYTMEFHGISWGIILGIEFDTISWDIMGNLIRD
jgi:cell shape-determining protein MreD